MLTENTTLASSPEKTGSQNEVTRPPDAGSWSPSEVTGAIEVTEVLARTAVTESDGDQRAQAAAHTPKTPGKSEVLGV